MDKQKLLCSVLYCFLLSIFSSQQAVQGNVHSNIRRIKLFVFGDSYADTGNLNKTETSWKYPYGITFPGKPTGRFSDGRVLTDYVAEFLRVKSPIPYGSCDSGIPLLKYGLNFAYGGTGVFDTVFTGPNMTIQINWFENLLRDNVFSAKDLELSASLVSLAGNDYVAYLLTNRSAQGSQRPLIMSVVNQLAINLKRIHGLGVKKIAVTGVAPFGCLPILTATSSFQQCNDAINSLFSFHNLLLKQAVEKLNKETKDSPFFIIDLYDLFVSAIKNEGSRKFENPLKPCCLGTGSTTDIFSCGSVDENGAKKYTLCENPKSSFFWDSTHPTQAGWRAVYSSLKATLEQFHH